MNHAICITGMGVVSSLGAGSATFTNEWTRGAEAPRSALEQPSYGQREAFAVQGFDTVALFGKRLVKAHDRVSLLLMGATDLVLQDAGLGDLEARRARFADDEVGMVIGTFGSLRSVSDFDRQTVRAPEYVTPTQFPSTVYCAAASYAAIRHAIRACCVTLTNGEPSSLQSFALGAERLLHGMARQVIVGGAEEISEIQALAIQAACKRRGDAAPLLGEGAAVFTLETREDAQKRGARELALVLGSAAVFSPDLQRGYEACVARLRRGVGDETFDAIAHVVGAGKRGLDERAGLRAGVTSHATGPRLGYLGSASGAFGVAAALGDRAIAPGALVLVASASDDGSVSTVLFRKLANASEEAS